MDFRRGIKTNKIEPFTTGAGVQVTHRTQKTIAADTTLTAADSGKMLVVTAADLTITLPSPVAGLHFDIVLDAAALATSTGLKILPGTGVAIGGNGLTSVDAKWLICAAASDREGDGVSLYCTAIDGLEWVLTRVIGTWAKEA